jgi:ribonuclease-3 family protein
MTQSISELTSAAWLAELRSLLPQQVSAMVLSEAQLRSLSPVALAYLGDAVYELFVRSYFLFPPQNIRTFHRQVVNQVRAEQQAAYLECLKPYLTDDEVEILRRGRNAASSRKQRASLQAYQQATALETLMGYLYLTDPPRLIEILGYLPLQAPPVLQSTPLPPGPDPS